MHYFPLMGAWAFEKGLSRHVGVRPPVRKGEHGEHIHVGGMTSVTDA